MGTELDIKIGSHVARARQEAGLTQQAVADAMRALNSQHRWSQATVWSIEKGDRPLRAAEVKDLAGVLGIGGMLLTNPTPETETVVRLAQSRNEVREAAYATWDQLTALATAGNRLAARIGRARRLNPTGEDRSLLDNHVRSAEQEYEQLRAFLSRLQLDGLPRHGHVLPIETLSRVLT